MCDNSVNVHTIDIDEYYNEDYRIPIICIHTQTDRKANR